MGGVRYLVYSQPADAMEILLICQLNLIQRSGPVELNGREFIYGSHVVGASRRARVPHPWGHLRRRGDGYAAASSFCHRHRRRRRRGHLTPRPVRSRSAGIVAAGFMTEKNKEAKEDAREPVLGRRVALLDGRRIHVHTSGPSGPRGEGPTVVFEAGHGETLLDWSRVMKELEQREPPVRCVAYTRAGLGLSDASAAPDTLITALLSFVQPWAARPTTLGDRSAGVVARELQQLLRNLEVAGPVVVVAHGAGGEFATTLAAALSANTASQQEQPGGSGLRVAGLVLVDPVVAGVSEEHSELAPEVASCLKGWRERSESNVLYAQVRGAMSPRPITTEQPPHPIHPTLIPRRGSFAYAAPSASASSRRPKSCTAQTTWRSKLSKCRAEGHTAKRWLTRCSRAEESRHCRRTCPPWWCRTTTRIFFRRCKGVASTERRGIRWRTYGTSGRPNWCAVWE